MTPGTDDAAVATDAAMALPTGPKIAVLPFDNLSGDPEQEYFADGLTEEIIAALTRFRDLFVLARNTTFQYKGRAVDVQQVGRDYAVDYVLEGSVRTSGNRVRITAQLIDAATGGHVWTDRYDREIKDIFAVQDDIAGQIAGVLAGARGMLGQVDAQRSRTSDDMQAYDHVLRALRFYRTFSPEDHAMARDHLEQAVALDPENGVIHAHLSTIYLFEHAMRLNPRPNARERAEREARLAVQLAPADTFARFSLAHYYSMSGQTEEMKSEIDRILALNSNDANALGDLGLHLVYHGEFERGMAMVEKGYRLDPGFPTYAEMATGHLHYFRNEYEDALAPFAKLAKRQPRYWRYHMLLAATYGQLGRSDEAAAALGRMLELNPSFPSNWPTNLPNIYPVDAFVEQIIEGLRKAGFEAAGRPTE